MTKTKGEISQYGQQSVSPDHDILQAFEADLTRAQSTGLRLLSLSVGESARLYCAGSFAHLTAMVYKHEVYDPDSQSFQVSALCAQRMDNQPCRWCDEYDIHLMNGGQGRYAKEAKRYEPKRFFLYPVFAIAESQSGREGTWRVIAGQARHPVLSFLYSAERESGIEGQWYRVTRTAQKGEGRYIIVPARSEPAPSTMGEIPQKDEIIALARLLWPPVSSLMTDDEGADS
ncbi:MAG: hypothetical protein IRZ31_20110 [Thermogemmatispora sp.]|jgi:hypothetical protein|uniref:hypothetical protein n=1 Tax=Thermogemmatispora sp. TaxID=1968838 RepID=UPI002632693F|nr:hypothetical protein [Thermogemmatispora sp.]MBX5459204.1 hypothetical protein [Thermogemmatispora sp.]